MALGILSKLYRNTGSYGSPTWTEINLVSDLQVNASWDEADGSARLSRVKQMAKTMLGLELSGKVRVDRTDAGYLAVLAALYSDTPMDLLVLNGPSTTNGVTGYRADFHVMKGDEDQGMGANLYLDVSFKPAVSSNLAKSVTVSGGSPVFTTITG